VGRDKRPKTASEWAFTRFKYPVRQSEIICFLSNQTRKGETMTKYTLDVKGMHCKSCGMLVADALEELGATDVKTHVDEKKKVGKVSFHYSQDKKKAIAVIEKEGYKVQK
jgi:copper chaperone CopZ